MQAGISGQFQDAEGGAFPPCGFDGTCDSISDLVSYNVGFGEFALSLAAMFAFGIFIMGGVMMIVSFGNPERFKKGTKLLVGAVIGLVISLSAYLLVNFVLDALGVAAGFRAL